MLIEKLRTLEDHCIGTAESEKGFLEHAFFNTGDYNDIIRTPTGAPILLVGKKGTGKSAILQYLSIKSKDGGIESLYIKPDNIPSISKIGESQDIATIKRIAYEAIIESIAIEVGSNLRGLLNRKDKKLFDKAVSSGKIQKDLIQVLIKPLTAIGSIVSEINFNKLLPDIEKESLYFIIESLKSNLTTNNKLFLLLVDDVDQVASPNQSNHINRIWGFILAIKKIAEDFVNIKCIITQLSGLVLANRQIVL